MKQNLKNLIPKQRTTYGGIGTIVYQLSEILKNVQFGEFISHISTMTYGGIISSFAPIVVGVILIMFDEENS